MSTEPRVWKDPQPMKVVFVKKVRKSKSGVEYSDYVPTVQGRTPEGTNRKARRKQASWERSASYRKIVASSNRKADKAHAKVVAKSKAKKNIK